MYVEGNKMNVKAYTENDLRRKLAESYADALTDDVSSLVDHMIHGTIRSFAVGPSEKSVDQLVSECNENNVCLHDFQFTDVDAVALESQHTGCHRRLIIVMTREEYNNIITGEGKG